MIQIIYNATVSYLQQEEVICKQTMQGRRLAAFTLLTSLSRRPNATKVFHSFMAALTDQEIGLEELAYKIDPQLAGRYRHIQI